MNAHKGLSALNALRSMISKIKMKLFEFLVCPSSAFHLQGKDILTKRIHYLPLIISRDTWICILDTQLYKFTCGKYWHVLTKTYTVKDNQVTSVSHFGGVESNLSCKITHYFHADSVNFWERQKSNPKGVSYMWAITWEDLGKLSWIWDPLC